MISGSIKFLVNLGGKKQGEYEAESGKCYLRIQGDTLQVVLEESDDWERNYSLDCKKSLDSFGFYGDDKRGVRTSLNFVNKKTIMGYWEEDNLSMPVIITLD